MPKSEYIKADSQQRMRALLREDIVMWPLAFMMFASTNTMWYFLTPKTVVLAYEVFAIFFPLLFFAMRKRLTLSCRFPIAKLALITLYLMAFASGALRQGTLPNLAYRMFVQLLPLIVLFATMKPGVLRLLFVRFEKVVLLFAIISIPCWLLFSVFDVVKPLTFSEYSWGGGMFLTIIGFTSERRAKGTAASSQKPRCSTLCYAPQYLSNCSSERKQANYG